MSVTQLMTLSGELAAGGFVGGVPITDGLIVHLDAGVTESYPGSGTTWTDLSSSGYTFTTSNSPTFTTDGSGVKCFNYSSGGEYFDSTSNSPFSGNSFAISVVAVVNQTSTGDFHGILTQHENDVRDSMGFVSRNGSFATDIWAPAGRSLSSAASTNTVQHVTWTVPSWSTHRTTAKIYINGVEQTTTSYGSSDPTSLVSDVFRVGNWQLNRTDMDFVGNIYAILVYNRELSAAETLQIFNATKSRYGIS